MREKTKDLSFLDTLTGFPARRKEKTRLAIKNEPIENLKPYIPKRELVYETPESLAGKLNSLPESLGIHVIKDFPKKEELVSMVVEAIKKLEGNERLDISNIRNGEQLSRIAQRVDMNDMRWHGGGSGGTTTTSVNNEIVSGSGTSFTLANTPTSNSVRLFGIGQRLTPTKDYTISGASVTTVSSWSAGDILADYTI
jgi:hypothetical protein